jgi:hypothetical protein
VNVEIAQASIEAKIEEIRDVHVQSGRTLNAYAQHLRKLAKKAITARRGE